MVNVILENVYKSFPRRGRSGAEDGKPAGGLTTSGLAPATDEPSTTATLSTVLRRINLKVQDGEFMVLVGPSGCGKSTLLRLIAGLEPLTAGKIWVGDRLVNDLPPKERDIAMVFQSYALYPHLSVYDNLAFGLRRTESTQAAAASDPGLETKSNTKLETTGTTSNQTPAKAKTLDHGVELPALPVERSGNLPASSYRPPRIRSRGGANSATQQIAQHAARWTRKRLEEFAVAATRSFPKLLRYQSAKERRVQAQVQTVAKMLQIEPLLERLPRQLSGGQKQRVALGRAMARNPQVFLMDEPLSNLDAKLRGETRSQIVNLQRQLGITTIYVTHDQTEAMTMGDRIAVMNQGQIQQVASPLELYHHPANQFVAGFIGSPPMNFLPVTVKAPLLITHADFRLTLPDQWEDKLRAYDGHTVVLGIRPEHLSLSVPAPKNIGGTVQRVEALGSETYLTVAIANGTLQARIQADHAATLGEEVWLAIAPDRIHLFDPETQAAL